MGKLKSTRMRFIVMLAFVAITAVGYFTALGVGNVCGIGFDTVTLLCPLGSILALISEKTMVPLALVSIIAWIAICAVLGKVFCSWICPVHFMVHRKGAAARVKRDQSRACGKRRGMKLDGRHAILAVAVVSTLLFGFPVFCLACPVGLTFTAVLLIMRLFAFGETTWTIILVLAVIAVEVVALPNWCGRFCPIGAFMSLASGTNRTFLPKVNAGTCLVESKGIACDRCHESCPEGIDLHDIARGATTLNDCSKCRNCAVACPTRSITFPFLPARDGNVPDTLPPSERGEQPCR